MPHSPQDFIGAWSLVDWQILYPDGTATRPFGENPRGYILYTENGIMSATLAVAERKRLGHENARNASQQQKADAFDSFLNYGGPWQLDGDEVVHTVTFSMNQDLVGTQQRRSARFDGCGGLELSAHQLLADGTSRRHVLQWQRV